MPSRIPVIFSIVHPTVLLNLYNTNNNAFTSILTKSTTIITKKVLLAPKMHITSEVGGPSTLKPSVVLLRKEWDEEFYFSNTDQAYLEHKCNNHSHTKYLPSHHTPQFYHY